MNRKKIKQTGRKTLGEHYIFLLFIFAASAFLTGNTQFRLVQQVGSGIYTAVSEGDFSKGVRHSYTYGLVQRGKATFRVFGVSWIEDQLGGLIHGEHKYDELMKNLEQSSDMLAENKYLGRREGVFATIADGFLEGTFLTTILTGIRNMTGSDSISVAAFILAALLIIFLIWFYFLNILPVLKARIFLEARVYERVPMSKVLFLQRTQGWLNVSKVMLVRYVYQLLWIFTIVGGVIKRYSYAMVPYILAENPHLTPKEAIDMSREMMDGHKWECFVLELSFWPWMLLEFVTLGLSELIYSGIYKSCVFAEYYVKIREQAMQKEIYGVELLNDRYLYEMADEELLREVYPEAAQLEQMKLEDPISNGKGIRCFIVRNFGISLFSKEIDRQYEQVLLAKQQLSTFRGVLEHRVYPWRLSPVPTKEKPKRIMTVNYMRLYSVVNIILFFFTFNVVGWLWEVGIHLVEDGVFINRGVLQGPWLPIYGSGGAMILIFLTRFRKKPWQEFIAAIVLCGAVEYATSYYLEVTKGGTKWWDYTGYFLNLNGRISAEGLLVFGIGGVVMVYFAAPVLDDLYRKINRKLAITICVILSLLFIADNIYSSKHPNMGTGITDYTLEASVDPPNNIVL